MTITTTTTMIITMTMTMTMTMTCFFLIQALLIVDIPNILNTAHDYSTCLNTLNFDTLLVVFIKNSNAKQILDARNFFVSISHNLDFLNAVAIL